MDTLTEPLPKKRGPKPNAKHNTQFHLWLSADLRDWAFTQPGGASALVRQLLEDERQRRLAGASREQ